MIVNLMIKIPESKYSMPERSAAGRISVAGGGLHPPPPLTIFNVSLFAGFPLPLVARNSFHGCSGKPCTCFVLSPEVSSESFRTPRKPHRMFRNPYRKSVKLFRTLADTRRTFGESYAPFVQRNALSGNPYGSFVECNETSVASVKNNTSFRFIFIDKPARMSYGYRVMFGHNTLYHGRLYSEIGCRV